MACSVAASLLNVAGSWRGVCTVRVQYLKRLLYEVGSQARGTSLHKILLDLECRLVITYLLGINRCDAYIQLNILKKYAESCSQSPALPRGVQQSLLSLPYTPQIKGKLNLSTTELLYFVSLIISCNLLTTRHWIFSHQ